MPIVEEKRFAPPSQSLSAAPAGRDESVCQSLADHQVSVTCVLHSVRGSAIGVQADRWARYYTRCNGPGPTGAEIQERSVQAIQQVKAVVVRICPRPVEAQTALTDEDLQHTPFGWRLGRLDVAIGDQ